MVLEQRSKEFSSIKCVLPPLGWENNLLGYSMTHLFKLHKSAFCGHTYTHEHKLWLPMIKDLWVKLGEIHTWRFAPRCVTWICEKASPWDKCSSQNLSVDRKIRGTTPSRLTEVCSMLCTRRVIFWVKKTFMCNTYSWLHCWRPNNTRLNRGNIFEKSTCNTCGWVHFFGIGELVYHTHTNWAW